MKILIFGLGVLFALVILPLIQGLVELALVKIEFLKTKISIKAQDLLEEKNDKKKSKIGFIIEEETDDDEDDE